MKVFVGYVVMHLFHWQIVVVRVVISVYAVVAVGGVTVVGVVLVNVSVVGVVIVGGVGVELVPVILVRVVVVAVAVRVVLMRRVTVVIVGRAIAMIPVLGFRRRDYTGSDSDRRERPREQARRENDFSRSSFDSPVDSGDGSSTSRSSL